MDKVNASIPMMKTDSCRKWTKIQSTADFCIKKNLWIGHKYCIQIGIYSDKIDRYAMNLVWFQFGCMKIALLGNDVCLLHNDEIKRPIN